MKKVIKSIVNLFYKLHDLYKLLAVLIAELLLTMGDLSLFLVVPELAPTLFTIAAIILLWKKWGNKEAIHSLLNLTRSLIFWSYVFVWIYPLPKAD